MTMNILDQLTKCRSDLRFETRRADDSDLALYNLEDRFHDLEQRLATAEKQKAANERHIMELQARLADEMVEHRKTLQLLRRLAVPVPD